MQEKEVEFRLKERKLNYRFHNPNSAEDTADFLCKLLIEVNADKIERAIEEVTSKCAKASEYIAESEDIKMDIIYIDTSSVNRYTVKRRES